MNDKLLKECLKLLLCDTVRRLYEERRQARTDEDAADITDAINERDRLLKLIDEDKDNA